MAQRAPSVLKDVVVPNIPAEPSSPDKNDSSPKNNKRPSILLSLQQDNDVSWLLLLAATAECFRTCYLPRWTLSSGVDLTSTFANLLGALIEGCCLAVERYGQSRNDRRVSAFFRQSFLRYVGSFSAVFG